MMSDTSIVWMSVDTEKEM